MESKEDKRAEQIATFFQTKHKSVILLGIDEEGDFSIFSSGTTKDNCVMLRLAGISIDQKILETEKIKEGENK